MKDRVSVATRKTNEEREIITLQKYYVHIVFDSVL